MDGWRQSDATPVLAIVCGAGLGAWMLPSAALAPGVVPPTSSSARSEAGPGVEAEPEGIAFHASSLGTDRTLAGDYGGRLTMSAAGTLRVDVPLALLRATETTETTETVEGDAAEGIHVVGLRLGLAESTDDGWHIVRSGDLYPVDRDLSGGRDAWLRDITLTLVDVDDPDLIGDGRWLVIIQELRVSGPDGWHTSWTYAEADLETLPRLLGWFVDGC